MPLTPPEASLRGSSLPTARRSSVRPIPVSRFISPREWRPISPLSTPPTRLWRATRRRRGSARSGPMSGSTRWSVRRSSVSGMCSQRATSRRRRPRVMAGPCWRCTPPRVSPTLGCPWATTSSSNRPATTHRGQEFFADVSAERFGPVPAGADGKALLTIELSEPGEVVLGAFYVGGNAWTRCSRNVEESVTGAPEVTGQEDLSFTVPIEPGVAVHCDGYFA